MHSAGRGGGERAPRPWARRGTGQRSETGAKLDSEHGGHDIRWRALCQEDNVSKTTTGGDIKKQTPAMRRDSSGIQERVRTDGSMLRAAGGGLGTASGPSRCGKNEAIGRHPLPGLHRPPRRGRAGEREASSNGSPSDAAEARGGVAAHHAHRGCNEKRAGIGAHEESGAAATAPRRQRSAPFPRCPRDSPPWPWGPCPALKAGSSPCSRPTRPWSPAFAPRGVPDTRELCATRLTAVRPAHGTRDL